MFNHGKRNLVISVIFMMIMGLAVTSVSAQATQQTSVYTYGGNTLVTLLGNGVVFTPGDTTVNPILLESGAAFNVVSYRSEAELAAGMILGQESATCGQTLVGNTCSISVSGTNPDMRFVVVPSVTGLVEIKYGGTVIARFVGGQFIFQPGDTTSAAKTLHSNSSFVAVNYRNQTDLVNGNAAMGSAPATCSTLVGVSCELSVANTTNTMWIKLQPATVVPVTATTTPVVAATPNPLLGQGGGANPVVAALPAAASSVNQNGWTVQYFTGATSEMLAYQFPALNPRVWNVFPNEDNPSANGFLASNGLEYGMAESQSCGSADDLCDIVVAARSYMLITGDYALEGIGSCMAANGRGCAIMIVNVGDVSAEFTGILNNVFEVSGRYWNGGQNFLPTAVVAGLSHANYNMLNISGNSANAGANCSVPGGCVSTDTRGVWTSGNQPLVAISTIANR